MSIAGSYSIADQLARTAATAQQALETNTRTFMTGLNRFHDDSEPNRVAALVG